MKVTDLLQEMAKRASPDQFYSFGKQMYGAEKVKALTWPEIKAIADKHDILIPAYLRSQKVGRGRFNIVPAEHADARPAVKFTPLSKPEDPRELARKGGVTDEDMKTALREMVSRMRDQTDLDRGAEWRRTPQQNGKAWTVEVRHWGHWQNPDDARDEEDYDWQELSQSTKDLLKRLCTQVEGWHKGLIKMSFGTEEKNWIVIYAEPK